MPKKGKMNRIFVVFPAENWQKNAKFWVCLPFFDSKKQVISNFETLPV